MNQEANKPLLPSQLDDLEQLVFELKRRTQIAEMLKEILLCNHRLRLSVKNKNGYVFIDIKDIVFIEACQENVKVHTEDKGVYLMSENLKTLEHILYPVHFLRVHRSYLVNLSKVKKLLTKEGLQIEFENNIKINVSRTYKKSIVKRVHEHGF